MSRFTHRLSFDTVLSSFRELPSSIDYAVENYTESVNAIRDWKQPRVKINVPFRIETIHCSVEVSSIGAALIYDEELSEGQVHISALYLQGRPIEECLRGTSFKYTESARRNFFAQGVLSMVYIRSLDYQAKSLLSRCKA